MKHNKYKILVLCDLKSTTNTILKSAVSLAKMINGDIEMLYVKNATEIVKKDNQLSAIRTINGTYITIDKEIQNLVKSFTANYNVNINYTFKFGNVKNEIGKYIKEKQPHIVVLGKRKSMPINFIGDNITEYVLKNHNNEVMIAAEENTLEPNKEISLGVLNNLDSKLNITFAKDLLECTQEPLRSFKTLNKFDALNRSNTSTDMKTVEYVFEKSDSTIKTLSKYLSKGNVNLLCVDRGEEHSQKAMTKDIKEVINKLNVSLLLTGRQRQIS
ncbi:universal stress protein [Snuella sedimenti]|uniref:Universal stress protein n=1 Tax=Snuella sedimenti TaxID=2798802 RepID=A0A8J7LXH9_9FLAO|nr:universal stress protein [Snuella sedimenti]MBJ6366776.1 universal stress protein [Snuella sedimenti]